MAALALKIARWGYRSEPYPVAPINEDGLSEDSLVGAREVRGEIYTAA